MNSLTEGAVQIEIEADIVAARRAVREAAGKAGFGPTDVTRIVTAASELARNTFQYGGKGKMHWRLVQQPGRCGLQLQFADQGPGIADINLALQEGYSTGEGLGMGLPGARRLMDEMDIQSAPGKGTTVTVIKWHQS